MNISKPRAEDNPDKNISPNINSNMSFFGVYDGHGGDKCADYLRDNLHQLIIKDPLFHTNPKQALINGCRQAELNIIHLFQIDKLEKSGSCAVVVLIISTYIHILSYICQTTPIIQYFVYLKYSLFL